MSVYVDECKTYPLEAVKPEARRWGLVWCRMTADRIDELHGMAYEIGLRRAYFQGGLRPHYDLTPAKRDAAIKAGAIEKSMVQQIVDERRARQGS